MNSAPTCATCDTMVVGERRVAARAGQVVLAHVDRPVAMDSRHERDVAERARELRPDGDGADARQHGDAQAGEARDVRPVPRVHRPGNEPVDPLTVRLQRPRDVRGAVTRVHPPPVDDVGEPRARATRRIRIAIDNRASDDHRDSRSASRLRTRERRTRGRARAGRCHACSPLRYESTDQCVRSDLAAAA